VGQIIHSQRDFGLAALSVITLTFINPVVGTGATTSVNKNKYKLIWRYMFHHFFALLPPSFPRPGHHVSYYTFDEN